MPQELVSCSMAKNFPLKETWAKLKPTFSMPRDLNQGERSPRLVRLDNGKIMPAPPN